MLRIGDKLGDELKIPREYKGKIKDIRKYCTKPELEMLFVEIINPVNEIGDYMTDEYAVSGLGYFSHSG